jgi:hypothetical protein
MHLPSTGCITCLPSSLFPLAPRDRLPWRPASACMARYTIANSVTAPHPNPARTCVSVALCGDRRYISRENMPNGTKHRLVPVQLPLFAEAAWRASARSATSGASIAWRSGSTCSAAPCCSASGRRLDPHPDPGAALNALARLAGQKRRRGYQDRAACVTGADGSNVSQWW